MATSARGRHNGATKALATTMKYLLLTIGLIVQSVPSARGRHNGATKALATTMKYLLLTIGLIVQSVP
jgi:hypothetical protein